MRVICIALAFGLAAALPAAGQQKTKEDENFVNQLIGGLVASTPVAAAVADGERHCHGKICHAHAAAGPNHHHDAYGNILYGDAVVATPAQAPAQVSGEFPQAHYDWCFSKFRSYDQASNTYQPFGDKPREACVSPKM